MCLLENSEHFGRFRMSFLIHLYTCLCLMHFLCVQVHVIPLKVKISTFDKMFLMEHILRSKGKMCLKAKLVKGFKMVRNKFFQTLHSRFTPVKQVWRPKQSHSKPFIFFKIWNALASIKECLWSEHPKYRKFSIHHKNKSSKRTHEVQL